MLRLAFPGLILGFAACAPPPLVIPSTRSGPAAIPVRSSSQIAGRWDVVSFEGYQPAHMQGASPAAFASFRDNGVSLRIECNDSSLSGEVRDGRFVARPGLRTQTEIGCGPEREERDRRYFGFFDRSPTIERLGNGRLRLTAGRSVLVLERPEQRRLAHVPKRDELNGRWRMEELTRYGPQGGESGIGLSDVPGRIIIHSGRIAYDQCPQYALIFAYGADGRLTKTAGAALPPTPNCPALKLPWQAAALPRPDEILPLLHANPWVEDVGGGRMLIANDRLGLVVTKEP